MRRRTFLRGAGATAIVVVGGGVWRAVDRGVFSAGRGLAYEPWQTWRTDAAEPPLALVRAGILAANPHNTQPWLFRVTSERIDLYADESRNLGAFDPYRREMHLGLGCALENMVLAAEATGVRAEVTLMEGSLEAPPPDSPSLVARFDLHTAEGAPGPLWHAIPERHTHRGPFDPARPLPSEAVEAAQRLAADDPDVGVTFHTSDARLALFRDTIVRATEAIVADHEMVRDSDAWFRSTRRDVQRHRDGVTLDAAGLPRVATAIAKLLPVPSAETNHRYWLDATRDVHVATAPAFGLITVRDLHDRAQTLRAGRLWQRVHLWATTRGIAMQPLNQPVEMVDRERSLNRTGPWAGNVAALTGDDARRPTFLFRAGYALRDVGPSPRRPIQDVLLDESGSSNPAPGRM